MVSSATRAFASLEHVYIDEGEYTATITVTDEDGDVATGTRAVQVHNVAPVITEVSGPASSDEGAMVAFSAVATDAGTSDTLTYTWNFGDGSPPTSGPSVMHTFADNGNYVGAVTVTDGDGGETVATLAVQVSNVAPVLSVHEDGAATEGTPFTIPDLATLQDAGFDHPAGGTSESFTYSIDWGDGTTADVGAITKVVAGQPGTPTTASLDGQHVYADDGIYTVTVQVTDDDGGLVTGTLAIEVENVAPLLTPASAQTAVEGVALTIDPLALVTDPGFDNPVLETHETFSYTIDWGDGSQIESGDASIDATGSVGVPTQASFPGEHIYADNGSYPITVTVEDDDSGIAQATVSVTVDNAVPFVTVPGTVDAEAGRLFTIDGTFTDSGSDRWRVRADYGDGTGWQPVFHQDKTLRLIHAYDAPGDYGITVEVRDDDGGVGTATINVHVEQRGNLPPLLNLPIPDQSVTAYHTFQLALDDQTFIDPEGQPLDYSATLTNGSPLPGWLTFDRSTRIFGGVPGNEVAGSIDIRVTGRCTRNHLGTQHEGFASATAPERRHRCTPTVSRPLRRQPIVSHRRADSRKRTDG